MAIRILSSENITGNLTVNGIAQIGASADANFSLGSSGDTFVLTSKKNGTDGIPMIFKVQASGGAIYERINITSGSITNIDVMSTVASEGIIRIGRYDANISRYNEIKNSVTSNGADSYMKLSVHSGTENVVTDVMTLLGDGNVGIGTPSPSVGLQLGNSTLGETKTAIFNSEGGGEVGLTVQSRTNRAKLRVADNDSNAYVVAEGGEAFFGISPNGDTQNLMITPSGYMSFGSVSEIASLYIQSSFTDAPAVKFYNSSTVGDGLFVEVAASSSSEFALKVTANGGLTNVLYARADGNVGIGTISPTQPLDVNGYSICDKQFQRDNSTTIILGTPRILNIGYRGSSGTYDFNPVTLFGNLAQGGQCEIQVTGWQNKVNNGFIYWRDNGSNTNIGNGIVGFVQTAVVGGGVISVSTNAGGNVITITFTGWHSNAHGWNAKIISNNS